MMKLRATADRFLHGKWDFSSLREGLSLEQKVIGAN